MRGFCISCTIDSPHVAQPTETQAVLGQPDSVRAVVTYYGSQNIDFDALRAPVLGHFAESDALVSDDELTELHAHLLLLEKDVRIHRYPDTRHGFAESGWTDAFDLEAADLAWARTLAFLYQS